MEAGIQQAPASQSRSGDFKRPLDSPQETELSHSGALVRTIAKIVSSYSVIDHSSGSCTAKTRYKR